MVLDCHSHRSSNQIHASMIQPKKKKKFTLQYGDEVIVNLFIYIYIFQMTSTLCQLILAQQNIIEWRTVGH